MAIEKETACSADNWINEKKKINAASLVPNPENENGNISKRIVIGTILKIKINDIDRFNDVERT